jgi:hypothetical protein
MAAGQIDFFRPNNLPSVKNLQNYTTTLLDADVQSQSELYDLTEWLASGLPGLTGNTLLLLRIGVPTPSAGLAFPRALQEQMRVQFYFDVAPGKRYIRHVQPDVDHKGMDLNGKAEALSSGASGPVYRLWISRLPIPHRHQIIDLLGL